MASFNRVTFGGSTDTISVPFSYLDKTHVQVYLDGVLQSSSAYTWPTTGQVKITAGNPASGVVGEVRRVTPTEPLVNFLPGNLDDDDLNVASLQPLFIAEEARDILADLGARVWLTSNFQTGGQITKGPEGYLATFDPSGNLYGSINAGDIEEAQQNAEEAKAARDDAVGAAAQFHPPELVLRNVSTRGVIPTGFNSALFQMQSNMRFFCRSAVSGIQFNFVNGYIGGAFNSLGPITISSALEYPPGTFRQMKWGGESTITIPAFATSGLCDMINVDLPEDAAYRTWTFMEAPDGIIFAEIRHDTAGDVVAYAVSGMTDQTMGGTVIPSTALYAYGPFEAVGLTGKPSIMSLGDSRNAADGSTAHFNGFSDKGNIAHGVGSELPYIQASKGGQDLDGVIAALPALVSLSEHTDTVLLQHGINSLSPGVLTAAECLAKLDTIIAAFVAAGKRVIPLTIEPISNGDASAETTQTEVTWVGRWRDYNDGIRAGRPGADGHIEFADYVTTGRNVGIWRVLSSGVALTSDRVHLNDAGHDAIDAMRPIDPRAIYHYPEPRPEPLAFKNLAYFHGYKAGGQTVPSATSTNLNWETVKQVGGRYDSASRRLYMPRGWYRVRCRARFASGHAVNDDLFLRAYLTDVIFDEAGVRASSTLGYTLDIDKEVYFNGSADNLRVAVTVGSSAGDKVIDGAVHRTYVQVCPIDRPVT